MPLFIECPAGHRLKVPKKHAGQAVVCPVCERRILVPALEPPSMPLEPVNATETTEQTKPAGSALQEDAVVPPSPKQTVPPIDSHLQTLDDSQGVPQSPVPEPVSTTAASETVGGDFNTAAELLDDELSEPLDSMLPPIKSSDDVCDQEEPVIDSPIEQSLSFQAPEVFSSESQSQLPLDLDDQPWAIDLDASESRHDDLKASRDHRAAIILVSFASIGLAILCTIPSFIDQYWARWLGIQTPDVWSYLVMLVAVIQVGVACFAIRCPDWSTAWVAGMVATAGAAAYALGLALTMFAHAEHSLVRKLGLLDEAFRWQAQPWCFFVMCLMLITAYCYGRFSLLWYKQDQQLAASRC